MTEENDLYQISDDDRIEWADPEDEEDWEPPPTVDPDSLPDNTQSWRIFYRWAGEAPKRAWPLALGRTREISSPWRRGIGISLTVAKKRSTFGIWWKGPGPDVLIPPDEANLQKTLRRARKYASRYTNEEKEIR